MARIVDDAVETGGLLIDGGWIRVLGGGHARLPRAIHTWNGIDPGRPAERLSGALLVADDAIGGFFALNGGGIAGEAFHVFYFSTADLTWTDVAPSYSDWLVSMMNGDLEEFYDGERWPGWEVDVASLPGDQAYSVYPPLFTVGPKIAERSRRAVPIDELWELYVQHLPSELTRDR